jgi:murein DD-endopeptidase MepM/ murein hydrolase activator NlpD
MSNIKHTTTMKHTMKCAVVLMFSMNVLESPAQFYTAEKVGPAADTLSISTDPYVRDVLHETKPKPKVETETKKKSVFRLPLPSFLTAKLGNKPPTSNNGQGKVQEKGEKSLEKSSKKFAKQPVLPFLSASDSMLLSILEKRLNICMPLDYLTVTSPYGYRNDPFTKCQKFHDGIDLRFGNGLVYSMLPGRVAAVHHGNTGYGNYVILDHGTLRCLYGHLSEIYAKEGTDVQAGTIVGFVGSTGRSTAPHLHIQLQRLTANNNWMSVDPMPFIDQLNRQVQDFNKRLAVLSGKDTPIYNNVGAATDELNIENLYAALKRHGIKYPKIVLAQAILETGAFRSRVCRENNNLFGLRHSKGYYAFEHWEESVIAYRDKVQYKHRDNENYYSFLRRIGYSTSKDYVRRVREIVNQL